MADVASMKVRWESEGEDKVANDADTLNKKLENVGSRAKKTGTLLTAGVTTPILAMGVAMFKGAADIEQTMGAVPKVFGESGDAMIAWSENSATAFGLTQNEALNSANIFGAMFKQLGVGSEEVANLSQGFVGLSADLSAMWGGTSQQASEALTSALRGNYEAMDKYGVTLTEATVSQRALEIAQKDGRTEMTEADKIMARHQLIMEQTADAQGQFAAESDTASGALAILKATIGDAATQLGAYLLPGVTKAVLGITKFVTSIQKLSPRMQKLVLIVAGVAAAIGPLLIAFGMMLPAITAIGAAIGVLLSPVGLVIAAIAALAAGFIYAYTHFESFRNIVDTVAGALWDFATGAINAVIDGWNALKDAFNAEGWSGVWDTIKQGAIDAFNGIIDFGKDTIDSLIDAISNVDFSGLLSGAWDAIQTGLQFAWDAITSINWRDFIPNVVWDAFITVLNWAQWVGGKIADIATWLWDKIKAFFPAAQVIGGAIADVAVWVWGKISGFFPAAKVIAGSIADVAVWAWSKIKGFFPAAKVISGSIADVAVWVWNKIKGFFPAAKVIVGSIASVGTWVWDKIKGFFPSSNVITGSIADVGAWIWGKIKTYFPSASLITGSISDLGTWLYEKIGAPKVSIPDFPGWGAFFDWINPFSGGGGGTPAQTDPISGYPVDPSTGRPYDPSSPGTTVPVPGDPNWVMPGGNRSPTGVTQLDMNMGSGGAGGGLDVIGQLNTLRTQAVALATSIGQDIGTALAQGLLNILPAFSAAVTGFQTQLTGFATSSQITVAGTVSSLLSAFTSFATQSQVTIAGTVSSLLSAFTTFAIQSQTTVAGTVSSLLSAFTTFATQSQTTIAGTVSSLLSAFTTFATQSQTTVAGTVSSLLSALTTFATRSQTTIAGTMSSITSAIRTGFTQVQTTVAGAMSSTTSAVRSGFTQIQTTIAGAMSSATSAVRSGFTQMQTTAAGSISSMVSAARSGGSQIGSGLSSGISTGVGRVRSTLNQIPGIINGIAGSGAGAAYNAGSAIGAGFANGMRAYLGTIRAAAAEMVAAASAAVLAKAMISSPSRLFKKYGVNVGEGFEEGVRAMIPAVARTTGHLVSTPAHVPVPQASGYNISPLQSQPAAVTNVTILTIPPDEWIRIAREAERGGAHARAWQRPDALTQFLKAGK